LTRHCLLFLDLPLFSRLPPTLFEPHTIAFPFRLVLLPFFYSLFSVPMQHFPFLFLSFPAWLTPPPGQTLLDIFLPFRFSKRYPPCFPAHLSFGPLGPISFLFCFPGLRVPFLFSLPWPVSPESPPDFRKVTPCGHHNTFYARIFFSFVFFMVSILFFCSPPSSTLSPQSMPIFAFFIDLLLSPHFHLFFFLALLRRFLRGPRTSLSH